MKRTFLFAFVLALLGRTASADPVCEMGGATVFPVMETVREQFLASDYEALVDTVTKIMPHQKAALEPAFVRLAEVIPQGFDSCATVLQRIDTGGMVQEITTFNIRDGQFPIAVYVLAFPVRGELEIGLFNFNTELSPVVDSLR